MNGPKIKVSKVTFAPRLKQNRALKEVKSCDIKCLSMWVCVACCAMMRSVLECIGHSLSKFEQCKQKLQVTTCNNNLRYLVFVTSLVGVVFGFKAFVCLQHSSRLWPCAKATCCLERAPLALGLDSGSRKLRLKERQSFEQSLLWAGSATSRTS